MFLLRTGHYPEMKDYLTVIWRYISLISEVLGREMIINVLYVSLVMRYAEKIWK